MSLNPTGGSNNWNFSNAQKDGYSEQLIGTCVAIQEVQARNYNPGQSNPGAPKFWPDGNPVMNIRMAFALSDGSMKSFTFGKAGKKQRSGEKPSVHMQMYALTGNTDMGKLVGKTMQITTWPANPTTGQTWGQGNPRLFDIQEIQAGPFMLSAPLPAEFNVPELLANTAASGGQPAAPAPAAVSTPAVPVNVPTAQPMAQPMTQVQPAVQAQPVTQQQPVVQAATVQNTVPAQTAAAPAGMDPVVAAAMQVAGATNIQPVAEEGVYTDEIPF